MKKQEKLFLLILIVFTLLVLFTPRNFRMFSIKEEVIVHPSIDRELIIKQNNDNITLKEVKVEKDIKEVKKEEPVQVKKDISKVVAKKATKERKEVKPKASRHEDRYNITFNVSFYSNTIQSCGNTRGISASGRDLKIPHQEGYTYVAMAKSIPFNTIVYIEGIGYCINVDTGGVVKGNMVDVFVPNATDDELMKMGRKQKRGYFVSK